MAGVLTAASAIEFKLRSIIQINRSLAIMSKWRTQGQGKPVDPEESGRPLTEIEAKLLDLASKKHKIRGDTGREEEISLGEAVIRRAFKEALVGRVNALRALLAAIAEAERTEQEHLRAEAGKWRKLKRDLERVLNAKIAKGEDVSDFVPHPDDIIIEADNTIRFKGPFTLEELARHRQTLAMIDLLFLQGHYENRYKLHTSDESRSDTENGTSAFFQVMFFNRSLPKRMQISEAEIQRRILIPPRLPTKREFKKAILEKYRALGVKTRKISCLPPLWKEAALLKGLVPMLTRQIEDARNGHEWSEQQGYEELLRVFRTAGFEIADA